MKKIYLIALGLLVAESSFAQKSTSDENVGIGTRNPHQSAVLDINSSEKGLLIPRLSINQRNSIAGPAVGLMVFQTDEKSGFYFFDGNNWKPLNDNDAKSVALDPNDWSFGGNTVSSLEEFQCLLGERLGSSPSEKVATIKKSTYELVVLDVLGRDYMPSDDE